MQASINEQSTNTTPTLESNTTQVSINEQSTNTTQASINEQSTTTTPTLESNTTQVSINKQSTTTTPTLESNTTQVSINEQSTTTTPTSESNTTTAHVSEPNATQIFTNGHNTTLRWSRFVTSALINIDTSRTCDNLSTYVSAFSSNLQEANPSDRFTCTAQDSQLCPNSTCLCMLVVNCTHSNALMHTPQHIYWATTVIIQRTYLTSSSTTYDWYAIIVATGITAVICLCCWPAGQTMTYRQRKIRTQCQLEIKIL